ncbi:MAG: TetR/AcrR family transcriptional regulator [Syntrophomonas sp.]|nr:TetR/AcrR family transcriptional regulator [Syntrophomonas sp.]
MQKPAPLSTKQKILQAAMDIIAVEGLEKTTVRKIAARAGVNIAAVNYHFGGKDAVINQSFAAVTNQLREVFRFLRADDGQDVANLGRFIDEYADIMFKYPDLLKNAMDLMIRHRVVEVDYLAFLQTEGIEVIQEVVGRIRPDLDLVQVQLKALQLISSLSYPFLLGDFIQEILGFNLHDPATRHQYTKLVLQSMFSPGKELAPLSKP